MKKNSRMTSDAVSKAPKLDWQSDPPTQLDHYILGLLSRVEAFCRKKNWTNGYFGKVAVGDDRVVERIRTSGRVFAVTIAELERYLNETPH